MALMDINYSSDKKADSHKREKLLTKVVIRRLPPSMDQSTFRNQISPVPPHDYLYMVKGDASLGENSFSRAYINFVNPNDIYNFREKFDNYVFLDASGHEYPAVVEFAAFQRIPKRRIKVRVDPKVGTIESDPSYLEFVEMINKPPEIDEKPEYSYQIATENKNDKNHVMTPLLEYVKNKKAEKMRIREERREERKRKEFERKKFRDDERKKRYEEKSPAKSNKTEFSKTQPTDKDGDRLDPRETEEVKPSEEKTLDKEEGEKHPKPPYYKNKEKKYEERKKDLKGNYPLKKDHGDKREYKPRREDYKERDYKSKYEEHKNNDSKAYLKKPKKYSEKREERKMEAQKAEQKKLEQQPPTAKTEDDVKVKLEDVADVKKEGILSKEERQTNRGKESDLENQKRIRNKDRPTIAIYRPGMLSKRKQADGERDGKELKK